MHIVDIKPRNKFLLLKEPKVTLRREGLPCPACAAGSPVSRWHELPAKQEPDGTYVIAPHGGPGFDGILRAKCTGKDCRVCKVLTVAREIRFTYGDLKLERELRIGRA